MADGDVGAVGEGVAGAGAPTSIDGAGRTDQPADTMKVAQAADGVTNVDPAASKIAGEDGYEKAADKAADKVAEESEEAKAKKKGDNNVPVPVPRDGVKNGDFYHDPRQLTPGQARDLEQMLNRNDLSDRTKGEIREFLKDYKDHQDRLFPQNPNPYPQPYPVNPAPGTRTG